MILRGGGSGSHRTDDQSTWAWSDNPALCIASYLLGVRVANSSTSSYDGQIIAGMGIDPERIDWANIIAEANSCDESVALNGGGSESRYTCNGFIDPRRSHRQNLEALASSMGGAVVFQGGKWRIYAAVSRAAVKTRDEIDMLSGIEYRAKKSRAEKANAVRGVYADVDAEFQPRDITPLINPAYVTEDGDDELWMDVNLPFTTSGTMAQRLAKIALGRSRMDKMVSGSFGPIALQDQTMDSLTFSYTPLGLSGQKMRVADWALAITPDDNGNAGLTFPVTLLEEDDAIYDWDETTDEQAISTTVTVARVEHNTATTASGDLAAGVGIDQGDGTTRGISYGKTTVQGGDGDALSFVNAYSEAPLVEYNRGGADFDGSGLSNTAVQQASIKALNVTASGFTIQAKIKEVATGIASETDGDGTGSETAWNSGNGPTNPDWQAGKEDGNEAWNDDYEWDYDVTATDFILNLDFVEVGFYAKINGAGWVKHGASISHYSTSSDNRVTRSIDGMNTAGPDGDLFGMDVEASDGDGVISDVEAVRWDRATGGGSITATPPGANNVVFIVEGGAE